MKIALDVFGGDNAPESNIKGVFSYLDHYGDSAEEIILLGDRAQIETTIKSLSRDISDVSIIHTSEVVGMNERASRIFREKPDSSLVKSIQLVKDGEAQAAVSAGNTGALLTSSLFLIGKIPGIRRPAFAPFIPTNNGGFILCDAGANADSKPQHLVQFALMASAYIEHLKIRPNPKVALLNIGREENKGNELMTNAYPMLKAHVRNFIGNIESRYILEGKADVVICDGFTGNIVLKLTEGIISHLMGWIQERIKIHSADTDISSIINPVFKDIRNTLDHEEVGAAPLLGINGVVMKCHGSSSEKGIKNSIIAAQKTVEGKLIDGIADRLSRHSDIFDEDTTISETNPV